ncbi:LysR family transcriptional regulator [Sphingomonas sp. SRS2]|uniref:LysR family transcriptional regulator n=1 Tax=Sphingomonas sp. SRS2 TaxID=133190 RepID=UPI0006184E3D|nr:LysR family transcriptional regulator [Sphingomonas sp. SRS2]KKC23924.1 hypothetical protein WP12_22175 [Sphingomonas sp. SRS2]
MKHEDDWKRKTQMPVLSDLKALEIFVAIVETQSITNAARRLGITPSTVSKKLAELEGRTESQLVNRSTRRMAVTLTGKLLYDHGVKIIEQIETAERDIWQETHSPHGKLTVAASAEFGKLQIAPHLAEFLQQNPGIELAFDLSPRFTDVIEQGTDLAIQIKSPAKLTPEMIIIARDRQVFCASPAYIERYGAPATASELVARTCLLPTSHGPPSHWPALIEGKKSHIAISGPLTSNSSTVLRTAALDGLGIAMLGLSHVAPELKNGHLIEILPGSLFDEAIIVAIVSNRNFIPRRVRLFIDFLKDVIGDPPKWERLLG